MKRASTPYAAFAILGMFGLSSLACTGMISDDNPLGASGGSGQAGGGESSGPGVTAGAGATSQGGTRLRVLTRSEYLDTVTYLLGPISAQPELPADLFTAGFSAIGGAEISINTPSVVQYESASRAIAAEVFADATRWQKVVGCQPQADLSDACVTSFIRAFGKRAFRRDLTDTEAQQWLKVGQDAAQLPGSSAALGLSTIVSGLLQSPHFLYRIETNTFDAGLGRLKYDGASMATRLAFLLTGATPNDALLDAAAAGRLDTVEGVREAAGALLEAPNAVEHLARFFNEMARIDLVNVVEKSTTMFPSFDSAMRGSMQQASQLFIKNIVLAPGADVRSLFDSDQTFVDATLAPIYGVAAPASGFAQIKLGAETGRAGILGQAGVLAGHSQADHNSPTRRGVFISETFLCLTPESPPPGVPTFLPPDPTKTERQRLDAHRTEPSCKGCHALFDPLGFGLERFDSIGQYRDTENGLPLDATGALDGVAFDGAAQMGAALRQNARAMRCMMTNFYRSATASVDASADAAQVEGLQETLVSKGYVWRDLVAEFVTSDAFRSAPATGK